MSRKRKVLWVAMALIGWPLGAYCRGFLNTETISERVVLLWVGMTVAATSVILSYAALARHMPLLVSAIGLFAGVYLFVDALPIQAAVMTTPTVLRIANTIQLITGIGLVFAWIGEFDRRGRHNDEEQ